MLAKHPTLAKFLLRQQLLVATSFAAYVLFASLRVPVNALAVILSALMLGNLGISCMEALKPLYDERPSLYNWLAFVALLALTTPVYVTATVWSVGWLLFPHEDLTWKNIWPGWEFSALASIVFGITSYGFSRLKTRLETRNRELEEALTSRIVRLELQDQELHRAREIQESLLPQEIPQMENFQIACVWQPARSVGGDYFDVLKVGRNKIGICIADVVGKGVSAALLMANVQAAVRAFALDAGGPACVCTRINSVLCGNIAHDKFVTFFYGLLDGETCSLTYCNAGHLPPILIHNSGPSVPLATGGVVLGFSPDVEYEEGIIRIERGDRLALFTDGITEAANASGNEYGDSRVESILRMSLDETASALANRVITDVTGFCCGQFNDDVTMMVVAAEPLRSSATAVLARTPSQSIA
ncbi:MAG TPA: PP2C family protein-serine/threonine phosphatase [Candidatus Sulfotelmatobacter sp.]|nr:PP2C family protein-serine/threonine phosphatase [Candidatus Sulfotelmatobacter sp.]